MSFILYLYIIYPLQCSCLENPRDGGAWWAAVYGVSRSRTRLKRLSSSSSIPMHSNPLNYELHLVHIYYLCYRIEYIQFNTSQFRQREHYQDIWDSVCAFSVIPFSLPNTRDYLNPEFCISHSWISLHRFILIYVCIPSQYSTYWLGFASFWPLQRWTSTWTDGITPWYLSIVDQDSGFEIHQCSCGSFLLLHSIS